MLKNSKEIVQSLFLNDYFHQILLNLGICEVKSEEVLKNIKWENPALKGCILKDLFMRNAQKKHIS